MRYRSANTSISYEKITYESISRSDSRVVLLATQTKYCIVVLFEVFDLSKAEEISSCTSSMFLCKVQLFFTITDFAITSIRLESVLLIRILLVFTTYK